jgi:phosphomethylpyrimidine synthase
MSRGENNYSGMARMGAKFKDVGGQVYLDAEKVKESKRVL